MKDKFRKIRQEKVAKLLFELGMDLELVSKISGIEKDKIKARNRFDK